MPGAARIGDAHACPQTGHGVNSIVSGNSTVLINGKPAAILGSAISHGGVIISASGNVLIGDTYSPPTSSR